jgi:16S rRNA (uracil1498-N3)-methyltransferase
VRAPRFFVEGVFAPGDTVALRGEDARKIAVVLRLRDGAKIEAIDSSGTAYAATIALEREGVAATLGEALDLADSPECALALAQGVPKGQKMDYVVEKASELGVVRIFPLVTERAVAEASPSKLERWRRLARTAAAQCGRRRPTEIEPALDWAALCTQFPAFDRVVVPWELAERVPLRERLPALLDGVRTVLIAIGPEGGLAHREAELAADAGAALVSLGERILRTETAGLVVCSVVRYALGEF